MSNGSRPGAAGGTESLRLRTQVLRWSLALILTIGAAGVLLLSQFDADVRTCRDVVASVGTIAIAEQCQPIELSNVLPIVLLAGLLLLPDLSEIDVTGIGSIKVRQNEQEARQGEIESSVAEAIRDLLPGVLASTGQEIGEKVREFEKALEEHQKHGGEGGQAVTAPIAKAEDTGERAKLTAELDAFWGRLEPVVRFGESCADPEFLVEALAFQSEPAEQRRLRGDEHSELYGVIPEGASSRDIEVLARWASVFDEEIGAVRLAHNAVHIHGTLPTTETVRQANDVAQQLEELLPEPFRS